MTVPESYEHVVTALETLNENELTLERVKSRLLEDELKQHHKDIELSPGSSTSLSLHVQKKNIKKFEKKVLCYICNYPNHKAD